MTAVIGLSRHYAQVDDAPSSLSLEFHPATGRVRPKAVQPTAPWNAKRKAAGA